jgi:hypothetical protein
VFVGSDRSTAVQRLQEDWRRVHEERTPRLVFLQAPLGWGKTRVVQEFYERLAREEGAGYWPPQLVVQDHARQIDDLSRERKAIHPPQFEVAAGQAPPFIWLAVHADPSEFARPDETYQAIVGQMEPHLVPILRRQRLTKAARRTVAKSVSAFLPIPADLETVLDLGEAFRDLTGEWREGRTERRTIGGQSSDRAARLWSLIKAVWGPKKSGPPVVLVIEDAHFLSEPVVDLLRALLSSDMPVLVVAAGWPMTAEGEDRRRPFAALVDSAPTRLRVEPLEELGAEDLEALLDERHPGTQRDVVQVLVQRTGGNPYALRLMLLRLGTEPGRPVRANVAELERMPFEIHAQFQQLLWNLDEGARLALAAASLLGLRMPEAVAREGAAIVARSDFEAALTSQWLRREHAAEDLIRFLEPLRREAAQFVAGLMWSDRERQEVLHAGLRVLRRLLTDDVADPDRPLLYELHVHFAEQGAEHDLATALRSGYALLQALSRQQARSSMRRLLERLEGLADGGRLSPEDLAEFAVERARARRLIGLRADAATSAAVDEALAATRQLARVRPDLRARALLEESRRRRDRDTPDDFDLARCRESLDEALQLIDEARLDDPVLRHNAQGCVYALASA